MKKHFVAISALFLSGCVQPAPSVDLSQASFRELAPAEKTMISGAILPSMKDAGSAQFKWMPLVEHDRQGIYDYCGLLNGKNSYGGYTGFMRFYAQLGHDADGKITSVDVRATEQPGREINPIDPRWMNGICEQFGYTDFSKAH